MTAKRPSNNPHGRPKTKNGKSQTFRLSEGARDILVRLTKDGKRKKSDIVEEGIRLYDLEVQRQKKP